MAISDIGDAIKDVLKAELKKQILARISFLSLPFIGAVFRPVIGFFVGCLVNYLVEETAVGLATLWILVNIGYEVSKVEKVTKALKDMLENPAKYTEVQRAAIEKGYDEAAVKLIHLSISRLN